jgi:hypothetical protein
MDVLDALLEGHPSRATLTTQVDELIDTLVRREARQLEPIVPVGTSFGVHAALTVVMVLAVLILGLEETGLYHPDRPNPQYGWPVLAFYAGLMLMFAGLAFRAWRRTHPR